MIAKQIKKLRKERNWSLEDLAKRIGSSKSYIWELEKGKTRAGIDIMINLSKAFNVSIDFLVSGEEPKDDVCRKVLSDLIGHNWHGIGLSQHDAETLINRLQD